jgi:hypothetical protein
MKSTFELPLIRSRLFSLLAVSFTLTLSHLANAASFFWTGASGVDTNWSTASNWSANSGSPGSADTAVFTSTNASGASTTVNNAVSVNTTITALINTNTTSATWHVTDIPAGVTLTTTNATWGGNFGVNGLQDNVAMTDAGTLAIYGNLTTGVSGSSSVNISTVDFSGLSNFVYNAAGGAFAIGAFNRSLVTFKFAAVNNNVTAGSLYVNATNTSNGGTGNVTLGGGTNSINVGTFNISAGRGDVTLSFPGTGAGLRVRGTNGADGLANMTVGNHNTSGSGSHANGTLSFNGNQVDMRLGTLTLGVSGSAPTAGANPGTGTLSFDTGTVFASNILMAVCTGGSFASASGTINVGANGTLYIGAGGMSMVNQSSGASTGTLNINGGSVIASNDIVKTTTAGTGAISMTAGSLTLLAGASVGAATNPINTISLSGGTLHLNVDGGSSTPIIFGSTVSASSMTIAIDSVANVIAPKTIPLISYDGGGDPIAGLSLPTPPPGYIASLSDDTVNSVINLSISPNVSVPSLVWKGSVNSTWDIGTTANWVNGVSPSTYANPDLANFNDTASRSTVTVSTQVGPGAFTFTNSSLNYTFNGSGAVTGAVELVKAGTGSLTLAETGGDSFSLGVTVTGGTVVLDGAGSSISGGATVSSGATLQIGNNDANGNLPDGSVAVDGSLVFNRTDNLVVSTPVSGSGILTQQGSGKLTLSVQNQYTGNTSVLHGTLALTGAGDAISNSAALNVNNAGFDVSGTTGTAVLNNLSLNNASLTLVVTDSITPISVASALSLAGAGNTIAVTSLPPIASYPTTLKLIQSGGAISGTFNLTVSSLPAGFVGTAIASGDNTAVLLKLTSGPVGVRPSVGWVGNNSVTTTTNWSDAANWQLPGAPVASDNVIFSSVGAVGGTPFNSVGDGSGGLVNPAAINNFVNSSFSVGTLTYTNYGGVYQNTLIADGASLTVNSNGSLVVGNTTVAIGSTEFVTIAGMNSTLNVSNTNGTMYVGIGNSGGQATLDLSGLGTLNASVSRLFVGVGSGSGGIGPARESGILYLAQTNTIKAVIVPGSTESSDTATNALAIDVGDDDGNSGSPCFLYLGQTNAIFGDAIGVGRQKPTGTMQFNPNLISANTMPSAFFRGANNSRIATWSIGDMVVNSGSGENATGTCDFSGGSVNALVNTMYVGRAANNSSGSGTASGTLTLDNGLFNVTTLYDAFQPSNSVKIVNATINAKTNTSLGTSGTITVSGNFNLAVTAGGTGAASSTGSLNVDGGSFSAGTIVCGTNGATSTITLGGTAGSSSGNGGVLTVARTIGSGTAPLSALNLGGGTLQLSVDGTANVTNIIATSISTSGITTLNIASVVHGTVGVTYPLISYAGTTDPFGNLTQGSLPAGAVGTLVDDTVHSLIGITFTSVPATPAVINHIGVSGITLSLGATNANPNSRFVLLGTTSLAQPAWKPVLTNTFDGNGNVNLSANIINPAATQQFYKLSQ